MSSIVPGDIITYLEQKECLHYRNFTLVGGGCINKGGNLETNSSTFFLKWNDAARYPNMFETESKGLALLTQAKALHIPKVIASGNTGKFQFILLEFIASKPKVKDYWKIFGSQLAMQHKISSNYFGLDHDNYIGSLPQYNKQYQSGIDFFIHQRLDIQLRRATSSGLIDSHSQHLFEKLYIKLPDLLPEEKPALLHGDLWSGNLITDDTGNPCLVDPAVYFGNREADLAMTMLFGGFDRAYFEAYHAIYPLLPGYAERLDIYNLYPLLVHVNLFGGNYASQVVSILRYFV